MHTYEITYNCTDGDWLSWRVECKDFHQAVEAAFTRLNMASIDSNAKVHNARLIRVEKLPDGYKGYEGVIT